MDNANSGSSGDCLKCSICKKRLARKSEYAVSECIEVYIPICSVLFVHKMCHFIFNGALSIILTTNTCYIIPCIATISLRIIK